MPPCILLYSFTVKHVFCANLKKKKNKYCSGYWTMKYVRCTCLKLFFFPSFLSSFCYTICIPLAFLFNRSTCLLIKFKCHKRQTLNFFKITKLDIYCLLFVFQNSQTIFTKTTTKAITTTTTTATTKRRIVVVLFFFLLFLIYSNSQTH